jgi:hypothetical protein
MKTIKSPWIALLAMLVLSSVAAAEPVHLQPGSVLIFPLYDSTPGAGTLFCVTNVNTSNLYCPESDYREGDVLLHYQYVAGDNCFEFDRYEMLTPGDTLCVIADLHNPEAEKGFLVVSAADPETLEKETFDFLIGSAIVVQSDLNILWSYTPYAFLGGVPYVPCGVGWTDNDGDEALDFNNVEYSTFPRSLMLDMFFEERPVFMNQLTLMSTTGQDYIAEVNFWFWNNIEERFSRTFKFVCWWSGMLSEISQVVTDLGGDEEEMGAPPIQNGWIQIEGNRILDLAGNPVDLGDGVPPILGVFAQFITTSDFAAGRALQYSYEEIDGLEILNGNGL